MDSSDPEDQKSACAGTCPNCARARRLVTVSVTARLDGTIACLENGDLAGAEVQAAGLEMSLMGVPAGVANQFGPEILRELKENAARGLRSLKQGNGGAALEYYRAVFRTWLQHYPHQNQPITIEPAKPASPASRKARRNDRSPGKGEGQRASVSLIHPPRGSSPSL